MQPNNMPPIAQKSSPLVHRCSMQELTIYHTWASTLQYTIQELSIYTTQEQSSNIPDKKNAPMYHTNANNIPDKSRTTIYQTRASTMSCSTFNHVMYTITAFALAFVISWSSQSRQQPAQANNMSLLLQTTRQYTSHYTRTIAQSQSSPTPYQLSIPQYTTLAPNHTISAHHRTYSPA